MRTFALIVWLCAIGLAQAAETNAPTGNRKVRIVLVGDSTATNKAGWGWASNAA
jgi:hypothetical protein